MLKRNLINNLIEWKKRDRKPLILYGARQVGKTTLIDIFSKEFKNYHKINFQSNSELCKIFDDSIDGNSIIKNLEIFLESKIDLKNDLIFFDEIQDCPKAINSLKFLYESFPNSYIISAGSYLGLVKNQENFPVGKVEFLTLYPLNFEEFLQVDNYGLYEAYSNLEVGEKVEEFIHEKLIEKLKLYWFMGGMPEIVQSFLKNKTDFDLIRKKQLDLLQSYKLDFSKYSGFSNALHILHVFESISSQLAQNQDESVKKFKFSGIIPKKKGFNDLIGPLSFLIKSSLALKVSIVNKGNSPLKAYTKDNYFKLYFFDIGLLNANLNINIKDILLNNLNYYKGFVVENFIACEIKTKLNGDLISWQEKDAEIEFLIENNAGVTPFEVKSSKKYKRSKSLDSFVSRYNPSKAYKLTLENYYKSNKGFEVVPMYLINKLLKNL